MSELKRRPQAKNGTRKTQQSGVRRTTVNKKKNWIEAKIERMQRKKRARARKIASLTPKQLAVYKRRRRNRRNSYIKRALLSVATILGVILVALYSLLFVVFKGPSQSFGDIATITMLETSALKFVPRLYYSNSKMEEIVARNTITAPKEDTDTSMININIGVDENGQTEEDYKDIEVIEISGGTYRGFLMIVRDPSRVTVGVCREDFSDKPGLQLIEIAQKYNAVAAINGGAFSDGGGLGNGGMPGGIVVCDGKLLHTKGLGGSETSTTVGFTKDHKLVVGEFSAKKVEELQLRDAVTFGPALVINGEACEVSGISSGLNPRTAIGQREDGAVLMVVIDGRQVNSMGATHADLMKIMLEHGAVNACNLDGGSSSIMYYQGKYLNNGVAVTGSRKIPTAFIVR